jgi:hypothetical protein
MSEWNGHDRRTPDHRLDTLERNVVAMREAFERFVAESTEYRRSTRRDIKCINDTWHHYLPMFDVLLEQQKSRRERIEKVKTHVIGWGAVSAISGIIYLIGQALRNVGKG